MRYMIKEPLETIGERIASLRRYFGMSQAELHERLRKELGSLERIGVTWLSKIENNTVAPSGERVAAIARILQTTTDYLWGNTDNPNISNDTPTMFSAEAEEAGKIIDTMQPDQRMAVLRTVQRAQHEYSRQAELDRRIKEILALVEARGGTDLKAKIEWLLSVRTMRTGNSGVGKVEDGEALNDSL